MRQIKYCVVWLLLGSILFLFSVGVDVDVAAAVAEPVEKGNVEAEEKQWAGAGFVKPKIEFINVDTFYEETDRAFTHSFDLTLVMFRGTGWSKKVVLQRLKKAADIYAQCGVRLGRVKFVEAGAPGGIIDFYRPGLGDVEIAQKIPPTSRPVFFYFRSIPQYNAYAWPEDTEAEDVPDALKNTAWFSLSVTMKLNIKIRHPKYVSEAHELGHILLDSLEHTKPGIRNLMAESFEYESDQFTSDQCRKLKEHPLVKRLNQ